MENHVEIPQKNKYRTLYDPAISLLGIYPMKIKTLFQRDIHTPMFIAALVIIAKIWTQPKYVSIDEWIEKMWYLCI